jgi:hypothetical protein
MPVPPEKTPVSCVEEPEVMVAGLAAKLAMAGAPRAVTVIVVVAVAVLPLVLVTVSV